MEELKGERNLITRIFLAHEQGRTEQPRKRLFITEKYLMGCLRTELNTRITKARLNQWVANQLLEVTEDRLFPIDSLWRIRLLEESKIEKEEDYTVSYLQQIFTYVGMKTNQIIAKGFYQKEWTPLSKATTQIRKFIAGHNRLKVTEEIESGILELKDVVSKFETEGWSSLSRSQKELINIWILDHQLDEERQIYAFMKELQKMICRGYSPQVVLMENGSYRFDDIDWERTLDNMTTHEYFDFLDTPQFGVYYTGRTVNITIKHTRAVNAKGIRRIDQIYNRLSAKEGKDKKGWGQDSGRKIMLEERDKELIRLHETLFKDGKYAKKLDFFMDEVLIPYTEKVGLPLKPEGVMKVIHKKE